MRFSVFTASTPEWTPAEAAPALAEAGYDGVEWRVTDQDPSPDGSPGFWAGNRCTWPERSVLDDLKEIRRVTDSAGLAMSSLGTYAPCDDLERVEKVMRAAAELGVGRLRVTVPKYDPVDSYTEVWERRRSEYAEVARLAARHGVRALVEIHHRTPVPSPHAAVAFVDGLDPEHVGVIHDVGNMVYEGWTDYRMGLEVLGDYLAHVHLKSAGWFADDSAGWECTWAPLRTGIVDLHAMFVALRRVGYDDWVAFEDFSTERPLPERVRDNLTYAKEAHAAAAL